MTISFGSGEEHTGKEGHGRGDEAEVVGSALMLRCLAAWQLHPALFWVACGGRGGLWAWKTGWNP